MPILVYVCFGLLGFGLVFAIGWRWVSRHTSLPCPTRLGWLVEMDNPFAPNIRASAIVQHLDLQPGMKVLDVGCGPGRLTIPLAQAVGAQGEVLAVDIQTGMLRRAQAKTQAAGLSNVQFLQAGAGEGKIPQGQFDRALLVTVLGEIPNREAALKEIFDALKPGGILSLTELALDPHFQRRAAVLRLTGSAGFREKQFYGNRLAYTLNVEKPASA